MYTPQAVINGEHEIVGSNAKAISNLIQDSGLQHRIIEGKLKGWHTSDTAWAQVNLNNEDPSLETILLLVQKEAVTKINAGENDGKKLQHINIVRAMQVMKKDKDGLIASIKYSPNLTEKDVRLIVLVQDKKTGLVKDVGIVGSWRLMISASF
ncbi:MAG: hypothetical protein JWN76_802 [Chitinophagaceae bacterium]|nr:hypothetical protein [Chitinophagaceae bacterium]